MELAKLILEYVKALAWPVLVGVVLWRFRLPIERLVERIASETQEIEGFGFKTKLRAASPEEQAERVQKEVSQISSDIDASDVNTPPTLAAGESTIPSDARQRYLLAEELVLRALELRWGDAIARHRVIELPNGRRIEADGILDGPRQVIVVEVKLLSRPMIPAEVFVSTSENLIALRQHLGKAVIGVVALVAPEETDAYRDLAAQVQQRTASAPTAMIAELFYFPTLARQFLGDGK